MRPIAGLVLMHVCLAVMAGAQPAEPRQSRQPVPNPEAIKSAETLMNEVFGAELARRSQAESSALAEKLIGEALKNSSEPATHYVLLREARERALRGGDAQIALAATERLTAAFEVDAYALKLELFTRCRNATLSTPGLLAALDAALALADERAAADRYDEALATLELASVFATRSRTPRLVADVNARRAEAKARLAAFAGYQSALEKLAASPKDPQANLTAGRFLCLHKVQWDKGLEHLAAGADADWAAAAKADLQQPDDPAEMIKAGDAWWDLALKEPAPAKNRLIQRAASWYKLAHPSVSGLQQARLDKRLQALTATGLPPLPVKPQNTTSAADKQPWDLPQSGAAGDPLFGDRTTPPSIPPVVRPAGTPPLPDPAAYRPVLPGSRKAAAPLQLHFPPKDLDRQGMERHLGNMARQVINHYYFPVPPETPVEVTSRTWAPGATFKAVVQVDFPDRVFAGARHPEVTIDTSAQRLRLGIWRDDGDALPSPREIFNRFVASPPPGLPKDPARAVHVLRRWLDLYHNDPKEFALLDDCYRRMGDAYFVHGSVGDLPALLEAEAKLKRGPRSTYAIHVEWGRYYTAFVKDSAKAMTAFERARAVARAHAADTYFADRVTLVDLYLADALYDTDKAAAKRHALAYFDTHYGRNHPLHCGKLLGNLYEAEGNPAAAQKLYEQILGHRYSAQVSAEDVKAIQTEFQRRIGRLRPQ